MKPMNGKVFADSNIILYLLSNDNLKKSIAKEIVAARPIVSTQVLSENINVLFKKFRELSVSQIEQHINLLSTHSIVKPVTLETIQCAMQIKSRYRFSWYDSTIIAAALLAECSLLYSEDLQDGQVIEETLTIRNPFIQK